METTTKNIKPNYKQTKVGVIPEDWEVKRLDSIGEVINGLTYSPKDINEDGVLVLRSSNVQNRQLSFKDNVYVNVDDSRYNPLKKNDILICVRNGSKSLIGKNALINKETAGNAFGAFMSVYRSDINEYIFQTFGTDEYLRQVNRNLGATINSINNSELRSFQFPIPPLPEQEQIASCLTTWDKGIEKLSTLIKAKKQQKKGLMQGLFNGQLRVDNGQLIQAKEGEGYTEDWHELRLNEFSKVNYGTRIVKDRVEEGKYNVYGGGGKTFTTNEYNRQDCMIIARFAMSKECARFVNGKFYLNDSGLTVKSNERTIQSFLDYLLFFNQHTIFKLRAGGAQQNLDVQSFRKLIFLIPSIEEQSAIAKVLTTADKEIDLLEQKLEKMQFEKKGLMQVLLTGKKRLIENQ